MYTGRLIVEFAQDSVPRRSALDHMSVASDLLEIKFTAAESMAALPGWMLADLAMTDADEIESIAARLNQLSLVRNAVPEIIVPHVELLQSFPNDPEFDNQWGLHNTGQTLSNGIVPLAGVDINAPEGWAVLNSAPSVTVAVMDTGIDYNHEDLAANVWANSGEIAGNGVDDDFNGYIDDVRGWDFGDGDNDPIYSSSHGTSVAGILGAVGNNSVGVAGVAWSMQVMPIKIFSNAGGVSNAAVVAAINYATANGATISNHSWGISLNMLQDAGLTSAQAQSFVDSICYAMGVASNHLFVVAAGNNHAINNDTDTLYALYPAICPQDNVVSVTGISTNDLRSGNYGPTTVDLAAPGASIRTTQPGNLYTYFGGTSSAAAFVTGAAALLQEKNPAYSVADIKAELLQVRPVTDLTGDVLSEGALYFSEMTTLPVTLSYFHAERLDDDTLFVWQTATEIENAGFEILAETAEGIARLNSALIPSHAVDSAEPLTYEYSTASDAARFYLQEVSIYGSAERHGPFELGRAYGRLNDEPEEDVGTTNEAVNFIYLPLIQ